MKMTKKYYFSRKETANVIADSEEEARIELATIYAESEDFILDDVMDLIELSPGEYKVVGR
jgi:hypothetical protein